MNFISTENLTVVGAICTTIYIVASKHKDKYKRLQPMVPSVLLGFLLLASSYSFGHMAGKYGDANYAGDIIMIIFEAFLAFLIIDALTA